MICFGLVAVHSGEKLLMAQFRRIPVTSSSRKQLNPLAKAMGRAKHSNFIHDLTLRGDKPLKLLGTPPDVWRGSVRSGTQIVCGKIIGGGHPLENADDQQDLWPDENIWLSTDSTDRWQEYLHSFNWLADINQAVDQAAAKKRAQELVDGWIEQNARWGEISWRPDIVGERITNWLVYTPLVLDSLDVIYRARVLDSLARSARHLMKRTSELPEGPGGLKAMSGLTIAALYIPGGEEWLKEGSSKLTYLLGKEVLVDGGIRSRNPQELLHLFMKLFTLRQSFLDMEKQPPDALNPALARMASNLKQLTHGDGKLGLFNGTILYNHEDVNSAISNLDKKDIATTSLQQSGFVRIDKGKTIILADIGPPAEMELSANCHVGTHSFEMSRGDERLIVNCGDASFVPKKFSEELAIHSRGSAAHSTLVLDGRSSCQIQHDGLVGAGITRMVSEKIEQDGHTLVESEHDGYMLRYGIVHKRLIYMDASGDDVRGEDILEVQDPKNREARLPFDIRFHLHPNVSVTLSSDGNLVYLGLSNGETWQFRQRGASLAIEESIYFGEAGKISPCKQIVLMGRTSGNISTVLWALKKG